MADEILSGQGLYSAEPFRTINPTGIAPGQALGTMQQSSQARQDRSASQGMAREQMQFQAAQNQKSMEFQERIEGEARQHSETMAMRAQKARMGEMVLAERMRRDQADPMLDLTLASDELDSQYELDVTKVNENLALSQIVKGLLTQSLSPETAISVVESGALYSKKFEDSASTLAMDALEGLREVTPVTYDRSMIGGLSTAIGGAVVGAENMIRGLMGAQKTNIDAKMNRGGVKAKIGDQEVTREMDQAGTDAELVYDWGDRVGGETSLQELKQIQREYIKLRGAGIVPDQTDAEGNAQPGLARPLSPEEDQELRDKAVAIVKGRGDASYNWEGMARRMAAVVGDSVPNKGRDTHGQVQQKLEEMFRAANQILDVRNQKGDPLRVKELADGVRIKYTELKQMGVNTTVLDLALSRMMEAERAKSGAEAAGDAGEAEALASHGMAPGPATITGSGASRLSQVLSVLRTMPGEKGMLFENWGGAQTKMNADRMNEAIRNAFLEIGGFNPDEQRQVLKALMDDDPSNDPAIAQKWNDWDPSYKKAFMQSLRITSQKLESELQSRDFEGSINPSKYQEERMGLDKGLQRQKQTLYRGARETSKQRGTITGASKEDEDSLLQAALGNFLQED